jgi:hypothetical protein
MHRAFAHRTWLVIATVAGLTLGACSHESTSTGDAGKSGRRGADAAKGSAGASSIDACRLLNKNEIRQQLGVAMNDGKLQTTSSQATCDWTAAGPAGAGLTVNVQDFDQSYWSSFTSLGRAKPVSGLAEAAFADVPLKGGLMIKQGKYEIDVGIVDFNMTDERAIAAAKALATLVLPRVSGSAQGSK